MRLRGLLRHNEPRHHERWKSRLLGSVDRIFPKATFTLHTLTQRLVSYVLLVNGKVVDREEFLANRLHEPERQDLFAHAVNDALVVPTLDDSGVVPGFDLRQPGFSQHLFRISERSGVHELQELGDFDSAGVVREIHRLLEERPFRVFGVELQSVSLQLTDQPDPSITKENAMKLTPALKEQILRENPHLPYLEATAAMVHQERKNLRLRAALAKHNGNHVSAWAEIADGGIVIHWKTHSDRKTKLIIKRTDDARDVGPLDAPTICDTEETRGEFFDAICEGASVTYYVECLTKNPTRSRHAIFILGKLMFLEPDWEPAERLTVPVSIPTGAYSSPITTRSEGDTLQRYERELEEKRARSEVDIESRIAGILRGETVLTDRLRKLEGQRDRGEITDEQYERLAEAIEDIIQGEK